MSKDALTQGYKYRRTSTNFLILTPYWHVNKTLHGRFHEAFRKHVQKIRVALMLGTRSRLRGRIWTCAGSSLGVQGAKMVMTVVMIRTTSGQQARWWWYTSLA